MRKLKSIRELWSMPVIVREGDFATLTKEERLDQTQRFSESDITLGLIQHDNHVSIHMFVNPSSEALPFYEGSQYES